MSRDSDHINMRPTIHVTGEQFNEMLKTYGDGRDWPMEFNQSVFGVGDVKLAPTVKEIPMKVVFEGNLDASESQIKSFDNEVRGDANFCGCQKLESFTQYAQFKGNVDARRTGLTLFTSEVLGDVDLSGCNRLKTISGAKVMRDMTVSLCTNLTKFGAVVGRNLDLRGCSSLTNVEPGTRVLGESIDAGSGLPDRALKKSVMAAVSAADGKTNASPFMPDVHFSKVLEASGISLPTRGRSQAESSSLAG
jgi:hypothetical protein